MQSALPGSCCPRRVREGALAVPMAAQPRSPGDLRALGKQELRLRVSWEGQCLGFQLDEPKPRLCKCLGRLGSAAGMETRRAPSCPLPRPASGAAPPAAVKHFVALSSKDLYETKLYCIGLGLHKFTICSIAYICSHSNLPLDGMHIYSVSCFNRKINVPISVCY